MSDVDRRVAALNSSIETRLNRYISDRRHIPGIAVHEHSQQTFMQAHQPEGGQWGAPCQGSHDRPTPWPCKQMTNFDSPLAYMD